MDEASVRSLVKEWYQQALTPRDQVSKFVFLYFCFNAWLAYESDEDRDGDMKDWLKSRDAAGSRLRVSYKQATATDMFSDSLRSLVGNSPIEGTGRRPRKPVVINSPDDFAGIVEAIYRVRCNLFHGGKRPDDSRDQELVKVCSSILEEWIGDLLEATP